MAVALTGLEAIESQKLYLKFFGIWSFEHETLLYKFRYYITCAICFVFTFIPFIEIFNHLGDYATISQLVSVLVSPLVFCLKVVLFKNSKNCFFKLLRNMELYPVDATEVDMLKALKLSSRLVKVYTAWYIMSVTVFLLQPALGMQDLPIQFSYNLGRYKILMYAYQVLGLEIVGIGLGIFDSLAINCINIGLAKFDILANKIRQIGTLPNSIIAKEFSNVIDEHNGLIEYVHYVEQVFTYCFFAQFFNSIFAICNIALQIAHVEIQSVEFAALILYFLSMLFELALYCWFGNQVIIKSEEVLQACYECGWYKFDIPSRKSLFIMMERSKIPLTLTAVKFTTLSLNSFVAIIRFSYSTFAVMQSMYIKSSRESQ